jgi:hypothetical protein
LAQHSHPHLYIHYRTAPVGTRWPILGTAARDIRTDRILDFTDRR